MVLSCKKGVRLFGWLSALAMLCVIILAMMFSVTRYSFENYTDDDIVITCEFTDGNHETFDLKPNANVCVKRKRVFGKNAEEQLEKSVYADIRFITICNDSVIYSGLPSGLKWDFLSQPFVNEYFIGIK